MTGLIRLFRKYLNVEAPLIDHVPVKTDSDWREAKLKEAATRYGKPFKCAAEGVPREVQIGKADGHMILIKGDRRTA